MATPKKPTGGRRKTSTTKPAASKPPVRKRGTVNAPAPSTPRRQTRSRTKPAAGDGKFVVPASAQRASSVKSKKIEWLVEDRIPAGKISLVAGRPGQGKSMFLAWLAGEVSRKHDVIFSNLEDDRADTSRPRLEAAGANLDRIHFWTPTIDTAAGLAELRGYIEEYKVKLLTVDPIAAHTKASIWNDQAIRQILTPLWETVLAPTGCAVVLNAHTTKKIGKSAHPLEAIGGSGGGLVGASRAVFVFGPNPHAPNERILAMAKGNLSSRGSVAFEMDEDDIELEGGTTTTAPRLVMTDPDSHVTAVEVLAYNGEDSSDEKDPIKTAVASEWITSYLMFGARPAVEVKEDGVNAGFTWTTIRRAAQESVGVERRPRPKGTGPGQLWALPEGHPALHVANIAAKHDLELEPGTLTVEDVLRMIDDAQGSS